MTARTMLALTEAGAILASMAATLTDTLRRVLAGAPSRYAVSMATGIPQSVLSRFLHGQADMKLTNASRLAEHFGLELRPRVNTRKRRRST